MPLAALLVLVGSFQTVRVQELAPGLSVKSHVSMKPLVKGGDGQSAPLGLWDWMGVDGQAVFTVMHMPIRGSRSSTLSAFASGMSKPGGGRIVKSAKSRDGLEWESINSVGMRAKWSAFLGTSRVYAISVTWRHPASAPKHTDAFIKSFRYPKK